MGGGLGKRSFTRAILGTPYFEPSREDPMIFGQILSSFNPLFPNYDNFYNSLTHKGLL
jgi:hypothetical protein